MSTDETINLNESYPQETWLDRLKLALGMKPHASIREDLEEALEEDTKKHNLAGFSHQERRILRNLLTARDIRVADVMIPRGAVIATTETTSFAELRALFMSTEHSRLPVYTELLDDCKGMVHVRDVFARFDKVDSAATIAEVDVLRPILFAPTTQPALDLLFEMQRKHIHMALVIDEYGAVDGLISLENLLEIIVGEIEDEHDIEVDLRLERFEDGSIAIHAHAPLEDVEKILKFSLDFADEEKEIGTIGGYVTAFLGRVPKTGEKITTEQGVAFLVLEGDARRLLRVRIFPPQQESED